MSLRVIETSGNSDDNILYSLGEVSLSDLLHLDENHGRDFLGVELLGLALVINNDDGLVASAGLNHEGPVLHVVLDGLLRQLSTDESLGVEDGVLGVSGNLILCRVTNESLILGKGDIRWGGVVTLFVGDDLDLVVFTNPHTNA